MKTVSIMEALRQPSEKSLLDAKKVKMQLKKSKVASIAAEKKAAREREDDPTQGVNLNRIAMMIETAIAEVFPDGDPFEYLGMKYKRSIPLEDLLAVLDAAAQQHLNAKNFWDYVADTWDAHAKDQPEAFGKFGGPNNPWR